MSALEEVSEKGVHRKHCAEPWCGLIKSGKKTIEGRVCKGDWLSVNIGDIVIFYDDSKECKTKIINLHKRNSFAQLISDFKKKLLPTIDLSNIQNGVDIYRQFYTESDEQKYGVLGIEVKLVDV